MPAQPMKLRVTIPDNVEHNSDEAFQQVDNAASQKASAWGSPTYIGTENGQHIYELDAIPRADPSIITTSNVAPILLPPYIA